MDQNTFDILGSIWAVGVILCFIALVLIIRYAEDAVKEKYDITALWEALLISVLWPLFLITSVMGYLYDFLNRLYNKFTRQSH